MKTVINTTVTILFLTKPVVSSSCYSINSDVRVVRIVVEGAGFDRQALDEIVVMASSSPDVVCRLFMTTDGIVSLDLDQFDLVGKSFRMLFGDGKELRFLNSDLDTVVA